jgi:hypothetical protein
VRAGAKHGSLFLALMNAAYNVRHAAEPLGDNPRGLRRSILPRCNAAQADIDDFRVSVRVGAQVDAPKAAAARSAKARRKIADVSVQAFERGGVAILLDNSARGQNGL